MTNNSQNDTQQPTGRDVGHAQGSTSVRPTPEAIEAAARAIVRDGFRQLGYHDVTEEQVEQGLRDGLVENEDDIRSEAAAALTAALPAIRAQVLAEMAEVATVHAVAKASWDRGEREYWDHESDMRPFDPTVTELDGDDCDRGREWVDIVTEVLTDLVRALANPTPAAKEAACSSCGEPFDSPPCQRDPATGEGGHTSGGGSMAGHGGGR